MLLILSHNGIKPNLDYGLQADCKNRNKIYNNIILFALHMLHIVISNIISLSDVNIINVGFCIERHNTYSYVSYIHEYSSQY